MWQRLRTHANKGQGMVEFALVIPILLLIIVGIFEAGRALYVYQSISSASREAARLGSGAGETSGTPQYLNCTAIRNRAVQIGRPGNVTAANVLISYDSGPGTSTLGNCPINAADIALGDRIIVQVTGTFQPGAPMPIFRFPTMTFTTVTRRTIVKGVDLSSWLPMFVSLEISFDEVDVE
ncbi:MAG TPA: pilus assembly protein [Anaerolineales bacterium]|nr:pilus assembly protein [Anaerolineales bacterium]HRQ91671.1 pilus assembly protein [Anaerolineales bacterium]